MNSARSEKIRAIVARCLGLSTSAVTPETDIDSAENWDSVRQLQIVSALEAELSLMFEPEEAIDMISVRAIEALVNEKLDGA